MEMMMSENHKLYNVWYQVFDNVFQGLIRMFWDGEPVNVDTC